MKKTLLLVVSFILAISLTIVGTVAYLTDRDSKVNVFTVGDVDIELIEDYVQGSELMPGTDINKDVQIKNIGSSDAWVWYTYAVPTALVDTGNNASKNAIHFNLEGEYWDLYASEEQKTTGKTWHWEAIEHNVSIDDSGIPYTVVTVLYNTTLEAGETTPVSLTNVYLDTRIDIDPEGNMFWVENGNVTDLGWNVNNDGAPKIYVAAYGIQADNLNTVNEAYAAYGAQWGSNGNVDYDIPVEVESADELIAAIGMGYEVEVAGDIVTEEAIVIDESAVVEIDLNGYGLSSAIAGAPALVNNGTLTISGGTIANNVNDTKASHAIKNEEGATLIINEATIGSSDNAGAAVLNDGGYVEINGGTFASKQEGQEGDGMCAYAFINNSGEMVINNATVSEPTHGLFGAYGGTIIVNGGNYTLTGPNACYITYTNSVGRIVLNGGNFDIQNTRKNRYMFTYDNGNKFGSKVTDGGYVTMNGGTYSFDVTAYAADGCTVTDNGDGTWTVTAAAE